MFAVIYIPQFALQAALRHEPELWSQPVALVDPGARTPVVCELTEPARQAGVTPGLTATQAMARCRAVLVRPRSLRQETAATQALLQCAYAFSPHLESSAPGVCTLDLRSLASLKGANREGLEKWAQKLQRALAGMGVAVAVGLATTPNMARHAARWGRGIELVETPESFVAGLPLAALEPSNEVGLLLKNWGIRTIGELLALGQEALVERLGLEALALIAAASTTVLRPLHLIQPTERFEEFLEFETAVETVEPLLFLLRRFVDQLCQRLEPRGFVAETMRLQLGLESGEKHICRLRLPQPTRQPDVLFRTLHSALENLRTDAAIQSVDLTVLPTVGAQKQLGLFETILCDPQQFQETLARLTAVLGPDRVGTPALKNSHQSDAFQMAVPDFENAPVPVKTGSLVARRATPIRRFRPAIKTEVECAGPSAAAAQESKGSVRRDHRPLAIRCAMSRGQLRMIVGPWRASGNWWEPNGWEREEWDASTSDGQVIRLVRQANGWFVEGIID